MQMCHLLEGFFRVVIILLRPHQIALKSFMIAETMSNLRETHGFLVKITNELSLSTVKKHKSNV